MRHDLITDKKYRAWLADIKARIRGAQLKAAVTVNTELLHLYWNLGAEIIVQQAQAKWGDGLVNQLSRDLSAEFPDIKGFSRSNLMHIKKWYSFYAQTKVQQPVRQIGQQPVGLIMQQPIALIAQIPWGHNIAILYKCKTVEEALYYVQGTIAHNWSRSVLIHQIERGLYRRRGRAVSNFASVLPKPQSDLAAQTLKDPYIFDFLGIADDYREKELETALIEHLTHFLLELGAGFAYLGRQMPLRVGRREFFLDLLFYHTKLHCYVVIELKTGDFEPEHIGKLNFYLKAVDAQFRGEMDNPAVGILICKSKDRIVAEYALSDLHKPIGVSEYELTRSLPETMKSTLPSIESLEKELKHKS